MKTRPYNKSRKREQMPTTLNINWTNNFYFYHSFLYCTEIEIYFNDTNFLNFQNDHFDDLNIRIHGFFCLLMLNK